MSLFLLPTMGEGILILAAPVHTFMGEGILWRRQRLRSAMATARFASAWPTMYRSSSSTTFLGVMLSSCAPFKPPNRVLKSGHLLPCALPAPLWSYLKVPAWVCVCPIQCGAAVGGSRLREGLWLVRNVIRLAGGGLLGHLQERRTSVQRAEACAKQGRAAVAQEGSTYATACYLHNRRNSPASVLVSNASGINSQFLGQVT